MRKWTDPKVRVRNMCMTIREALAEELLADDFVFLVGKQLTLSDITIQFILTNEKLGALFLGADATLIEAIPNARPLDKNSWDQRKWGAGVPDFAYTINGRIVVCFYATAGWLNPLIKAHAALKASVDVQVVLVYPTKGSMAQDIYLDVPDQRMSYIALDEWAAGNRKVYRRIVDRKGERWEETR